MKFSGDLSLVLDVDSYKSCHFLAYPPGMTRMVSYFESRGGGPVVFFGLQYILKERLSRRVTGEDVDEADAFFKVHGEPFNRAGWMRVVEKHGGYLPLEIRAVPEGTVVPERQLLFRVESTDPELAWLASYVETMLVRVWYPCTVATRSWRLRRFLLGALRRTADKPEEEIWFKLHDFGARGVSSLESAALGGAAHLVNFMGSDTVPGVALANQFYGAKMAAFSIPACFDDQTEILTEEGFIPFVTLRDEMRVAQYTKSGHIEFVVPSSTHRGPYSGTMVRFDTAGDIGAVDMVVTPNHRVVRKSVATGEIEVIQASDAGFSQRNVLPQAGLGVGDVSEFTPLDALRFAFQADGSFVNRKDSYTGVRSGCRPIRFSLKKDRKKEQLREILSAIGWEWTECAGGKPGYTHFWIKVPVGVEFSKDLDWVPIGRLSASWCARAVEEIVKWDGQTKFDTAMFHSTNRAAADVVQAIGTLAGRRSSMTEYEDPRGDRKTLYTVFICGSTGDRGGQGIRKGAVEYTGEVYCVTVPSGMVVVRRGGYVFVSGNSEHSTITTWGKDGEIDAYEAMLKNFAKPGSLVAVVSDSYDLWNAIRWMWGSRLRERVVQSGATIVIRPDSGDPPEVVLRALRELDAKFGHTVNTKGFKVLNNVRVIQGDGITEDSLPQIVCLFEEAGYSASNVAFGMGGGLLQQLNRDTHAFAYKACHAQFGSRPVEVSKDPVDAPEKRSKGGDLDLIREPNGEFFTIPQPFVGKSYLQLVYRDGEVFANQTLDDVRKRASEGE